MTIPKFDEKELKVVREVPSRIPGGPSSPVFDFPVSAKEGYIALVKDKKPIWQLSNVETTLFCPNFYPDNIARGFTIEANPLSKDKFGGKDMFGIEWVFVDVVGGSMVKPGSPFLEDANDWKTKLVWPDVDSWDWAGSAKANKDFVNNGNFVIPWIMNGYFERLISFMDFEGAVLAMIDEDQKDAVKELYEALTDLYIKIVDKFVEYFPNIGGICVHDDWGSQRAPFFSPAVCNEMLVPPMKRLVDHMHSKGLLADFHSCGHVEKQVPNMIEIGWDTWTPMPMNDTHMLYEKYGDKLAIGVIPDPFDPLTASVEEQQASAAKYVEKFCQPGKTCVYSNYGAAMLTPAFREVLYKASRQKCCEMEQMA